MSRFNNLATTRRTPPEDSPRKPSGGRGRRSAAAMLVGLLALPAFAQLKTGDDPDASAPWQAIRKSYFGTRPIAATGESVIDLETPVRAEDAAVVPIAIRARFPQSVDRYIDKLYLVIDNNPAPVAAVFTLTPTSGRADIETRVRIDEYSFVRAIAETNDGKLYMSARFVKASGGCSAPPGKDAAAALATLGKTRFRVEGEVDADRPALAQLMISHPNSSGMVMDQVTRDYTPPHFVKRIDVSYGGKRVLSADVDFAISENPNFRFYFLPAGDGELKADIVDSKDLHFASTLALQPSMK